MHIALLDPNRLHDMEIDMVGRLCKLLLNPSLNRRDIANGILADEQLMNELRFYETIVIEAFVPPGSTWEEMSLDIDGVDFACEFLPCPREKFAMPLMIGTLTDEDDFLPWFQSSVYEFTPFIEGMRTSNIGGKPFFNACLHPVQESR